MSWTSQREITAPDFTAGRDRQIALPKENVVRGLQSILDYSVVVTGGSGAGAPLADAAHRTHDVVHVERKGIPIHHVKGHTLGRIVKLLRPAEWPQADASDDAAATYSDLKARVYVPFYPLRVHEELARQFGLSTRRQNAINFHVKWGEAADLFNQDVDFTSAAFGGSEAPKLIEEMRKGVTEDPASKWGVVSYRHIEKVFSSDQQLAIQLEHLTPGTFVARIFVEVFNEGSGDSLHQYADDVATQGRLRMNGANEFEEFDVTDIQARNKAEYGLASVETGVFCLDFAEDGNVLPGQIPVVRDGERPTLYLDVDYTGANGEHKVVVTTETLMVPPAWLGAS